MASYYNDVVFLLRKGTKVFEGDREWLEEKVSHIRKHYIAER